MARINLLPWREEQRERRNKEFLTLLALSLILALAAAFATWTYFNNVFTDQQLANDYIAAENQKLDAKLTEIETLEQRREDIISRMQVIQNLQGKRPLPVRVWDDVAKAIPDEMYLTTLQRTGDTLTFTGRASNPNVVSSLVRNLDASKWLDNSKVSTIKSDVTAYGEGPTEPKEGEVYPEDNYDNFVVTTQIIEQTAEGEPEEESAAVNKQTEITHPIIMEARNGEAHKKA